MTAHEQDAAGLDYLSFVDYAIAATTRELPAVDPVAMRLVFTGRYGARLIRTARRRVWTPAVRQPQHEQHPEARPAPAVGRLHRRLQS